jgi:hypothetical protein
MVLTVPQVSRDTAHALHMGVPLPPHCVELREPARVGFAAVVYRRDVTATDLRGRARPGTSFSMRYAFGLLTRSSVSGFLFVPRVRAQRQVVARRASLGGAGCARVVGDRCLRDHAPGQGAVRIPRKALLCHGHFSEHLGSRMCTCTSCGAPELIPALDRCVEHGAAVHIPEQQEVGVRKVRISFSIASFESAERVHSTRGAVHRIMLWTIGQFCTGSCQLPQLTLTRA